MWAQTQPHPPKPVDGGGEVALGGCSLKESTLWVEEEVEVTTLLVLLLLKTFPSSVSSSSSEGTTTTPLPLSRGAGVVAVSTMVRGTTAMGGGDMIPIARYRCFIDIIWNQLELEYD